jgi:hypothetical protein
MLAMTAMFEFSGQLSVTNYGSGWQAYFEVYNVGAESGEVVVAVNVDGNYDTEWRQTLSPSVGDRPTLDLGHLESGVHTVEVYLNPGSGQNDHLVEQVSA